MNMNMKKLVLIDANNLAHRYFWSYQKNKRKYGSGLHYGTNGTSIILGFLKELITLEKLYPNSDKIMSWDSKSMRRKAETTKAKESGLIKTGYKELRKPMEPADQEVFDNQIAHLKVDILPHLAIMQTYIQGFEADDVIHTYTQKYDDREIIISSSDRDFYQDLEDRVIIVNMLKDEVWTKDRFLLEYGFPPNLFIDYGALVGESGGGDNIPGVPKCGDKSAKKLVQDYGSIGEILKALAVKENRSKMEESVLNSVDLITLSYSLKKMDILNVPDLVIDRKDVGQVKKMLIEWGCMNLMKDADKLA